MFSNHAIWHWPYITIENLFKAASNTKLSFIKHLVCTSPFTYAIAFKPSNSLNINRYSTSLKKTIEATPKKNRSYNLEFPQFFATEPISPPLSQPILSPSLLLQ